jgi:hypothetical protein
VSSIRKLAIDKKLKAEGSRFKDERSKLKTSAYAKAPTSGALGPGLAITHFIKQDRCHP